MLLTFEMMIYDRSSPGQPRLNSTGPTVALVSWGWLSCWTRCRQISFGPFSFLHPDGRSSFRRSLLKSFALGLLPELELMVAMGIGGDPSEMIRS